MPAALRTMVVLALRFSPSCRSRHGRDEGKVVVDFRPCDADHGSNFDEYIGPLHLRGKKHRKKHRKLVRSRNRVARPKHLNTMSANCCCNVCCNVADTEMMPRKRLPLGPMVQRQQGTSFDIEHDRQHLGVARIPATFARVTCTICAHTTTR